jgi:hypothetical protein
MVFHEMVRREDRRFHVRAYGINSCRIIYRESCSALVVCRNACLLVCPSVSMPHNQSA